jgi:hypothetical protein
MYASIFVPQKSHDEISGIIVLALTVSGIALDHGPVLCVTALDHGPHYVA